MNNILLPLRSFRRSKSNSSTSAWSITFGCLMLAFGCVGLSSCGTARGFGHDVEHVGEEIQEHVPH